MNKGFQISGVKPGSLADKAALQAGDRLLKINGSFFYDLVDFHYLCAERRVTFQVEKNGRTKQNIVLRKGYDEDTGVEFLSPAIGPLRRCQNHCVFCFIDQQPPFMRSSLYEKDDDYRLSFFHGNYISLTNLGEMELERIRRRKLSPLYISIHATDPAVRLKMMRQKNAGNILEQLRELARCGIEMHGQLVLCPGYNDGTVLEKTIQDLVSIYPALKTVALIPVGLTGHREKLTPLRSFTPGEARMLVEKYSAQLEDFCSRLGEPFIYLADEFYLLSGFQFPTHEHYGAYHQLENGVGISRLFLNQMDDWRNAGIPKIRKKYKQISLVTAKAAEPLVKILVEELEKIPSLETGLHVIPHYFWGGDITVSGLLTGSDLMRELSKENSLGDVVFIPRSMLKKGSTLFLDNITIEALSSILQVRIIPVDDPAELRRILST
jgi:putative radical SAM enzyme (TIGR03279 family)